MPACAGVGSWGWKRAGQHGDPQQDIATTPKQVSSAVMRQTPHGSAQDTETLQCQTQELWGTNSSVPTGHRCTTCVPKLLQGSSGGHGTMASLLSAGVLQGSQPGKQLSSQCPQPGLTAVSIPPSPASLPGTEQVSSHLSQPAGPTQILLGFRLLQVRLQLL